ncbi:MAG: HEAT repeat domain-containing protein [Planctomycetes bacterium]|nr:HEAT repeat domain-containing protein [Planctomycetota bacterium]
MDILHRHVWLIVIVAILLTGCAREPGVTVNWDIPSLVDTYTAQLHSPDAAVRASAALKLGELGLAAAPAAGELLALYDDTASLGEEESETWLNDLPEASYVWPELDDLPWRGFDSQWSTEVRQAALWALQWVPCKDAGPLEAGLADASADRRRLAAEALPYVRGHISPALMERALHDENKGVRTATAIAMGYMADPASVSLLIGALGDNSAEVREEAARALGSFPGNEQASVALVKVLADEKLIARAQADTNAALHDPEQRVRTAAADSLGRIGHPSAQGPLEAALNDPVQWVADASAEALGAFPNGRAARALLTCGRERFNYGYREGAIKRIGAAALGPLREAMQNPKTAEAAARAVIWLAGQGTPILVEALKSENVEIRRTAASCFEYGYYPDPRATDALLAALSDSDVEVRRSATAALWPCTTRRQLNRSSNC